MGDLTLSINKRRLFTSIGSAFFLSSLICSLTGKVADFSSLNYSDPNAFLLSGVAAVAMLALLPAFRSSRVRVALCFADVALVLAWAAAAALLSLSSSIGGPDAGVLELAFGASGRIASIMLTVQWNLHMASYRENGAITATISTGFATAALYLLFSAVGGVAAFVMVVLATLLSTLMCLYCEKASRWEEDAGKAPAEEAEPGSWSLTFSRILFFGSRVAWGALFGILLALSSPLQSPEAHSPWLTFLSTGALVLAYALIESLGARWRVPAQLAAVFPLLLFLALASCFAQGELSEYGRLFAGIVFLPWFMQMWMQLPSYRDIVRMSLPVFSYLERLAALIAFEFAAFAAMKGLAFLDPAALKTIASSDALGWYAVGLVTVTTIATCRHFYLYYPAHGMICPAATNESQDPHQAAKDVSERAGLSKREEEVFVLLAEGYSRPYIEKRLYISTGTAKTHIYHVYKKLGVSSQDELIEQVKSRGQNPAAH